MPTLYITDNILKVERAIKVSDKTYCPAREDGIASIEYSEATVQLLLLNQLNFILEIAVGGTVAHPDLIPHPDNAANHTNWFIPKYWKPEIAFYDVEYKTSTGDYKYKNRLSAQKFAEGFAAGFKITRVFSENGLTQEFLNQYGLTIFTKGKLIYAAKMKKKGGTPT